MAAVGIDGGMYIGGRIFLEIGANGRFYAHERVTKVLKTSMVNIPGSTWIRRDLSETLCFSSR